MQTIRVLIHASDPIDRAGIVGFLRPSAELEIVADADEEAADVLVLAERTITGAQLDTVRRICAESTTERRTHAVLVTDHFNEADTIVAARYGVLSILPQACVSAAVLHSAVVGAANGTATMPGRLQAALLRQLDQMRRDLLEPNGMTLSGLALRELDVISLVAEGLRIDEIASKLSFSEGTVKRVLYGAMGRLGLANRARAVAYAVRTGALVKR